MKLLKILSIFFLFISIVLLSFDRYIKNLYDEEHLLLKREMIPFEEVDREKNIWRTLHFSYFSIPMPRQHPLYKILPYLEGTSDEISVGFKLTDLDFKFLNIIEVKKSFIFNYRSYTFIEELPIIKNYIERKGNTQIFEDLFSKISKKPTSYSYKEIIYRKFILNLRKSVFKGSFLGLDFYKTSGRGFVRKKNFKDQLKEEFFFLKDDRIHQIVLHTNKFDDAALSYREKFFNKTIFLNSSIEVAKKIYFEYIDIKRENLYTEENFVMLFSAWSHDLKQKKMLHKVIDLFERGDYPFRYFEPLYKYLHTQGDLR